MNNIYLLPNYFVFKCCLEKQNKLANLLSSLLVCAFKLAQEA